MAMAKTKMYVYCETCEDWHIVGVLGLTPSCEIICGHTTGAGMHDKLPPRAEISSEAEAAT